MSAPRRARWSLFDAWVVAALVIPVFVAPGAPTQTLAAAYAVKSLIAVLLVLPWIAFAPRVRRIPRAAAPILVLAGVFAISAIAHPPGTSVEAVQVVLRIALPLAAVVLASPSTTAGRAIIAGIIALAGVLALLTIIESLGVPLASAVQARPAVFLLHRNNVAFHLSTALPLCVAALIQARRRAVRIALAAVSVAVLAAIVIARSRGAWLAAGAGVLPLLLVIPRGVALRLAGIAAVLAVGLGVWSARAGLEPLSARVRGAFDPSGEAAWFERVAIYRDALARIAEHPFAGWGAGSFATRHTRFLDGRPADHPHDDLLTAGYEAGIGGALSLGWVLVSITGGLLRRTRRGRRPVDAGLAGSMLAWCIAGAVNSPLALSPSAVAFWWTAGTALSLSPPEDP